MTLYTAVSAASAFTASSSVNPVGLVYTFHGCIFLQNSDNRKLIAWSSGSEHRFCDGHDRKVDGSTLAQA